MIAAFLSLITTLPSLFGSIFTYLTSKDATAKAEALATIQAYVSSEQVEAQLKQVQWGWWGTRYLMAWAAFGPIWHWNLVFLDTCPWVPGVDWLGYVPYPWLVAHAVGSWHVGPAPGEYAASEFKVILSFFAVGIAQTGLGTVGKLALHSLNLKQKRWTNEFHAQHIAPFRDPFPPPAKND